MPTTPHDPDHPVGQLACCLDGLARPAHPMAHSTPGQTMRAPVVTLR